MLLAVRIVGVIYIAAMVVMGGLWRGALRQQPSSPESSVSPSNIVPIRNAPARPAGGEAGES